MNIHRDLKLEFKFSFLRDFLKPHEIFNENK